MNMRNKRGLRTFTAPLVLLAVVFGSFLFPNSRPFWVSASRGSTGAHTTDSVQQSRISGHAMLPTANMQTAARNAEANKGMPEKAQLSANKRGFALVPGWNDRNPKAMARHDKIPNRSEPSLAESPNSKEVKEQLYGNMRRPKGPPWTKSQLGPLVDSPFVKDAFQMLDTLGLPKEPSKETLDQLRFLFLMLSDDLNLYDPELGKCIYIPNDLHTLSRLKALAKYYTLNVATAEAIATLPPFHELFCFSNFQQLPMMWFLGKYINREVSESEGVAIEKAFEDNRKRSDEIGPLAFNPIKRFLFDEKREVTRTKKGEIIRDFSIYSPEKWVMRMPPVRPSPFAQFTYPLARKQWVLNSLSELVDFHPGLDSSDATSDLTEFIDTPIGQSLLLKIKQGNDFIFDDLKEAEKGYQ